MNLTRRKSELVKEFSPMLEKTSLLSKIWIWSLVAILIVGAYALFLQIYKGQSVTGMRDNVVWGIYTVNFIFFLGMGYSGAFISSILHFIKTPWKNSVSRIVEIITVLSILIGPIFILLCIYRLDRLHYLFMYPRIQSPITWDVIAVITDLIGCFLYLYLTFIPDLAILRDNSKDLNVPQWKKNMYRYLAIGYQNTDEQREKLHKITKTMSVIVIALAIVAYTILAWVFSLTLQPGWNSTIFAPYFIVSGLYTGVAVIILAMFLIRKYLKLEKYLRKVHFIFAGVILLILSLLFGYFTFSEYFPKWFSHKESDANLLNTLFNNYFWMFIIANYGAVLLPLAIISFKKLRTVKLITLTAVIAIIFLWLNRYLIIIPTLETPYLPIQDTRLEYVFYTATWVEWSLTFAGIAAFCLLFTLLMKFVPIIPMSGIIENETEQTKKKRRPKKTVTE